MKTGRLILVYIYIPFAIFILSCKKEEIPQADNQIYPKRGYIKGNINGEDFKLQHGTEGYISQDTAIDYKSERSFGGWVSYFSSIKSEHASNTRKQFNISFTTSYESRKFEEDFYTYFNTGTFNYYNYNSNSTDFRMYYRDENGDYYSVVNNPEVEISDVEKAGLINYKEIDGNIIRKKAVLLKGKIKQAYLQFQNPDVIQGEYEASYDIELKDFEFYILVTSLENY